MKRCCIVLALVVTVVAWVAQPAKAIPILQLYIEGAQYDPVTETWVAAVPSSGGPFRLWTIANIAGPGGKGSVTDVRLAVTYSADLSISINLTPTLIGGSGQYQGVFDRYLPSDPIQTRTVLTIHKQGKKSVVPWDTSTQGLAIPGTYAPVLGVDYENPGTLSETYSLPSKPTALPKHDAFGPEVVWQEFYLGDFTDPEDALVADLIDQFPPIDQWYAGGQINAYEINVTRADGGPLHGVIMHFDLYDSTAAKQSGVFAPFSHDASLVPEPTSATALLGCLVGLVGLAYRRTRRSAKMQPK